MAAATVVATAKLATVAKTHMVLEVGTMVAVDPTVTVGALHCNSNVKATYAHSLAVSSYHEIVDAGPALQIRKEDMVQVKR